MIDNLLSRRILTVLNSKEFASGTVCPTTVLQCYGGTESQLVATEDSSRVGNGIEAVEVVVAVAGVDGILDAGAGFARQRNTPNVVGGQYLLRSAISRYLPSTVGTITIACWRRASYRYANSCV